MRTKAVLMAILIAGSLSGNAQTKANYQQAAKYSPSRVSKLIFSQSVMPNWLKNSDRFWYTYQTSSGKNWYIVDPAKAEKKLMFDNGKIASELTRIVKDPFDALNLPIDSLFFLKDENWIQFQIRSTIDEVKKDTSSKDKKDKKEVKTKKMFYFRYNLSTRELVEVKDFVGNKRRPIWANISPDSSVVLFGKNDNLWMMDKANFLKAVEKEEDSTIVQTQLTFDGEKDYSYYGGGVYSGRNETNVDEKKNKDKRKPVSVNWSPNGKHFALVRSDVRMLEDFWVLNSVALPRPTLETYKYWMAGEKDMPTSQLYVFNVDTKQKKTIKLNSFKGDDISIYRQPIKERDKNEGYRPAYWLGDDEKFYLSVTSRDLKDIQQVLVTLNADSAKTLVTESLNTYVDIQAPDLINGGKEFIEWSEQDGWAHLYLYDGNGKLKNQITSGEFHVSTVERIDEKTRTVYFTANGREKDEDPYYFHLYSANFDGSNLRLLNSGNFSNDISINDNATYFVNNSSRVNTAPKSALYNNQGRKILDLETADLKNLMATGYKFPEPFTVKAADGITDLYGVMYKPFDFDSTKKYPLIEYVYPGPQTEAVNKSFNRGFDRIDRLAQLGFIVVTVGNRGGHPDRSKAYHNYGYGNLRDYGLADKKAAAEQLADRFSFIDGEKVGIHGHSGGGFMSTAAMLVYPDFFKVAVSNAGNHDNSIYNRWWSEKHHGVKREISEKGDTSFVYNIEKNPDIAKNLKGRLMLIHGEIDNNVHPANTMRVVNALIKANKRFEMLLLPNQRHAFGDMNEYWFWKTADYFSKYLLGDNTERPVDITELNNDIPQRR